MKTTKKNVTIFRQVCELIPPHVVQKIARDHEIQTRKFSAWSHVVSLLFGHMTRSVGLNDICDALELNRSALRNVRGATPPKRNTFSHANRTRDPRMAEALYWHMLKLLQSAEPSFAQGRHRNGYLRRFKGCIHAVDSTTIGLVANCMDWAKHRRRKAAAKCHMNLDLRSMLPRFAAVDTARHHDSRKAWEVCAGLKAGEIVVFDRAYVDFSHLGELSARGVFWVTRTKKKLKVRTVRQLKSTSHPSILRDEQVELVEKKTRKQHTRRLRLVEALVVVDGKQVAITFLSNNLDWSAWSVAELYRARWDIEVFFKEIKQTLQLVDFVGHNRAAVQWQIWIGLLTHLLMRFLAHLSRWTHSFTRLFTFVRSALWHNFRVLSLLGTYGTASGTFRILACPNQLYFAGFGPPSTHFMGQPKSRARPKRHLYEEIMQSQNQPSH